MASALAFAVLACTAGCSAAATSSQSDFAPLFAAFQAHARRMLQAVNGVDAALCLPGIKDDCFFGDYTCQDCCATGTNAAGVSCWNDLYTKERCCPFSAPVRAPPTSSPAGVDFCARSLDDTCWGNEFVCNQCCLPPEEGGGMVYMAGPNGPELKSCWSDQYINSAFSKTAAGEFMVRTSDTGETLISGQDAQNVYSPSGVLEYVEPAAIARIGNANPNDLLWDALVDSTCKTVFEPLNTTCPSSAIGAIGTPDSDSIKPTNAADGFTDADCKQATAAGTQCAERSPTCASALSRCLIQWITATSGNRIASTVYAQYLQAWLPTNAANVHVGAAGAEVARKDMTFSRCCKAPPGTRPPDIAPTQSPTTTSPTNIPSQNPTALPTTLNPTEVPTTPSPTTPGPTAEDCKAKICPVSWKDTEDGIRRGCNEYHDGSGQITDGFWSKPPTFQYPANYVCEWIVYAEKLPSITTASASDSPNFFEPITINFDQLSLERGYDFLHVYTQNLGGAAWGIVQQDFGYNLVLNATCELNVNQVGKDGTCFTGVPPASMHNATTGFTGLHPVTVSNGLVKLVFRTDANIQRKGFNVSFTVGDAGTSFASSSGSGSKTPQPSAPEMGQCKGKGTQNMDFATWGASGSISSGLPYAANSDCTWLFFKAQPKSFPAGGSLAAPDMDVVLSFTSFDTEAQFDTLMIYDGSTNTPLFMPSLSGPNMIMPGPFTIKGGYARVVFSSDFSMQGAGFVMKFDYVQTGVGSSYSSKDVSEESDAAGSTLDTRVISVLASGACIAVLAGLIAVVVYRSRKNVLVAVAKPSTEPAVVAAKAVPTAPAAPTMAAPTMAWTRS